MTVCYLWIASAGTWTDYAWPKTTINDNIPVLGYGGHGFWLLTEAFIRGQSAIPLQPDSRLVAATPLSVEKLEALGRGGVPYLVDFSLYHGKYYLYLGPVPAILLFLPWKLMTGRYLPNSIAITALLVGALVMLVQIAKHWERRPSRWLPAVLLVGVGFGNLAPFLLATPFMYSVPFASLTFFTYVAILLYVSLRDQPRTLAAVLFGLSLGGMTGSRVTAGPAALFLLSTYVYDSWLRSGSVRRAWRIFLPAGVTYAMTCAGLVLYNVARFGHPLEFGTTYMLNSLLGVIPGGASSFFAVRNVGAQLFYICFGPFLIKDVFPFIAVVPTNTAELSVSGIGVWPRSVPHPTFYTNWDLTATILLFSPILLIVLWLIHGRVRQALRDAPGGPTGWRLRSTLGIFTGLMALPIITNLGLEVRHMADFLPSLLLLVVLLVLAADEALEGRARFVFRVTLVGLTVLTVMTASLTGIGAYQWYPDGRQWGFSLLEKNPNLYVRLASADWIRIAEVGTLWSVSGVVFAACFTRFSRRRRLQLGVAMVVGLVGASVGLLQRLHRPAVEAEQYERWLVQQDGTKKAETLGLLGRAFESMGEPAWAACTYEAALQLAPNRSTKDRLTQLTSDKQVSCRAIDIGGFAGTGSKVSGHWSFGINGTAQSEPMPLVRGRYVVRVRARGVPAKGVGARLRVQMVGENSEPVGLPVEDEVGEAGKSMVMEAELATGGYRLAITYLNDFFEPGKGDRDLLIDRVWIARGTSKMERVLQERRYAEALKIYEQWLPGQDEAGRADTYVQMGQVFELRGDRDLAVCAYSQATAEGTGNAAATKALERFAPEVRRGCRVLNVRGLSGTGSRVGHEWSFGTNGDAWSEPFALERGYYRLRVWARGVPAAGQDAQMRLRLVRDTYERVGQAVENTVPEAGGESDLEVEVASGQYRIGLRFLNDFAQPGVGDRDLLVSRAWLVRGPSKIDTLLSAKRYAEAIDLYEQEVAGATPKEKAETYGLMGRAFEQSGDRLRATCAYQVAAQLSPADSLPSRWLAQFSEAERGACRLVAVTSFTGTGSRRGDSWFIGSNGTSWSPPMTLERGKYNVQVRAHGQPVQGEDARLRVQLFDDSRAMGSAVEAAAPESGKTVELALEVPAGRYRVAISFLNDFYRPGQGDRNLLVDRVWVMRGKSRLEELLEARQFAEAIDLYEQELPSARVNEKAETYMLMGQAFERGGDRLRAGCAYQAATQLVPTNPLLLRQLAQFSEAERRACRLIPVTGFTGIGTRRGDSWFIGSNGTSWSPPMTLERGKYSVQVRAHGEPAQGEDARLRVQLVGDSGAGASAMEATAPASGKTVELALEVPAGRYRVAVSFLNDFYRQGQGDRNLLVDRVWVVRGKSRLEELLEARRFGEAIGIYEQWLHSQRGGQRADILLLLGNALEQSGATPKATCAYSEATKWRPGDSTAQAALKRLSGLFCQSLDLSTFRDYPADLRPQATAETRVGGPLLLGWNGTMRARTSVLSPGKYVVEVPTVGQEAGGELPRLKVAAWSVAEARELAATEAAVPSAGKTLRLEFEVAKPTAVNLALTFLNDYYEPGKGDRGLLVYSAQIWRQEPARQ